MDKDTEELRPLSFVRDLPEVTELLKLSFPGEFGYRTILQLRIGHYLSPVIVVMRKLSRNFKDLFPGYVLESQGQIIGTIFLSKIYDATSCWSITVLAVHPDFRRRGLARRLIRTAIIHARARKAKVITLHVDEKNEAARNLCANMGFLHITGETKLTLEQQPPVEQPEDTEFRLSQRKSTDAEGIWHLLEKVRDEREYRITPLRSKLGFWSHLSRFTINLLLGGRMNHFVLRREGEEKIIGVLNVEGNRRKAPHHLKIIVHPDYQGTAEHFLIYQAFKLLKDYPARRVDAVVPTTHQKTHEILKHYGFTKKQTLLEVALKIDRADELGRHLP